MNLFCFSLEGSMDSLYEVVQDSSDGQAPPVVPSRSSSRSVSRSCSRSCSPAVHLEDNATKWQASRRSISMETCQSHGRSLKKKKRRTHISKSASDNEALDSRRRDSSPWQPAGGPEGLAHIVNNHNEEFVKTKHRAETKAAKGRHSHTGTKKKDKPPPLQTVRIHEGSTPCPEWTNGRQKDTGVHSNGTSTEHKPTTVKRSHSRATKKPGGKNGKEGNKKSFSHTVQPPPPSPVSPTAAAPPAYLDVPYRQDRRLSSTLPPPTQENPAAATLGRAAERTSLPGGATPTRQQRWSNPAEACPAWEDGQHTCRRLLTAEYQYYSHHDFTLTGEKDWEGSPRKASLPACGDDDNTSKQDPIKPPQLPPRMPRAVTDTDLSRSTSFGRFEGLRHQPSPAKLEENGSATLAEEPGCESSDQHKSAGLGKKMKAAISLTMRRKMGKKHLKEAYDDADRDPDSEAAESADPRPVETKPKTRASLDSLYSGQSSSSGVTSVSDGSSHRNSLRLEEDGSYHGQFCGRARVHTDFVPSPYDTDSLKLKVGDIISIISKPPMGIWTGMLNNKVGNFKFIYVDILAEKEKEEEDTKIRDQKLCKKPRPKTLIELLERLNLEEYTSALLLNGYQTVDDLMHLKEKHLIELNVNDPEHRRRLLAAADCRYAEGEDVIEVKDCSLLQEEDSDCPRDSGCFIPSECSENSKEEGDHLADAEISSH